jgi:TatD DNase family protein
MICIGASDGLDSNFKAIKLAKNHSEIFCTIGIHPHDADKVFWTKELEEEISFKKVLAIGETGLDFFKEWSDFTSQKKLFRYSIIHSLIN